MDVLNVRVMFFDRYGDPDVMSLREVPVPGSEDSDVLIRAGYAGVDPSDSNASSGSTARAGCRYREVLSIRHWHGRRPCRGVTGVELHPRSGGEIA
jgi:hypothetical protein